MADIKFEELNGGVVVTPLVGDRVVINRNVGGTTYNNRLVSATAMLALGNSVALITGGTIKGLTNPLLIGLSAPTPAPPTGTGYTGNEMLAEFRKDFDGPVRGLVIRNESLGVNAFAGVHAHNGIGAVSMWITGRNGTGMPVAAGLLPNFGCITTDSTIDGLILENTKNAGRIVFIKAAVVVGEFTTANVFDVKFNQIVRGGLDVIGNLTTGASRATLEARSGSARVDGQTRTAPLLVTNLPTSDPGVPGALWRSTNDIKVSSATALATIFNDTFTDDDGTLLDDHPPEDGSGWTIGPGSWEINTNRAVSTAINSTATPLIPEADGDLQFTAYVPASGNLAVSFRVSTDPSFWIFQITAVGAANGTTLTRFDAGSPSASNGPSPTLLADTPFAVRIILNGTSIQIYAGGTLCFDVTDGVALLGTGFQIFGSSTGTKLEDLTFSQ